MIIINSTNKANFRQYLLLFFMLCISQTVFCDNIQKSINTNYLRTPEASAFKKYGEESVNEYTGTADISVPLYTIKNKDLEIPIVLRYDASGIKVEQEASWVGLGWNLMVGGCINYVCAGGHDIYNAPEIPTKTWTEYLTSEFTPWTAGSAISGGGYSNVGEPAHRNRTKYYTYDSNDTFNWMNKLPYQPQNFVQSYVDVFSGGWGMKEYLDWGYGERDFYSVNVMGKSFMFFIDPATLKVFYIGNAGEEFIVTPDFSRSDTEPGIGNIPDVGTWKITDSSGYNYYFAVRDKCQYDNKNGQIYSTCWYLTKIQSPLGETAELEYSEISKSPRHTLVESYNARFIHSDGGMCCSSVARDSYDRFLQTENSNMSMKTHYLKKISTNNQVVTFSTESSNECSGRKLNSITAISSYNDTIKNIKFSYGSFVACTKGGNYAPNDPNAQNPNRLKLNNVKEIASSKTLTTNFEYNEDVKLPLKRSCAQDYWGYYNGQENNVSGRGYSMVPTPNKFMSARSSSDLQKLSNIKGANRASNASYMQAAILKKIVYPTGGYTTYEYEPNSCTVSQLETTVVEPDINIYKSFSYTPDAPVKVSNTPYKFTLTKSLDYSLSVRCNGDAINGSTISVVIVSLSTGGTPTEIPVKYQSSNDYIEVKTGTLLAGNYQLIIGAPSSGTKSYGIGCQLKGYYANTSKSNTSVKTYTATVGGLRVKKISNFDNDNTLIKYTTYDYGGGVLLNNIETIDYAKMYNNNPQSDPFIGGLVAYMQHAIDVYTITSGHPRMPAFYASCNPGIVGYSNVTKCIYNANDTKTPEKKIVTSYHNNAPTQVYGVDYYTIFSNGQLLSQEIYDSSNKIVAKTENTYGRYVVDHYATNIIAKPKYIVVAGTAAPSAQYIEYQTIYNKNGGFVSKTEYLPSVAPSDVFDVMRYPFILSRVELEKTITTEYCTNGSTVISAKKYTYNNKNHQVSQIDEFRSDNVKNARNDISLTNNINRTKIKYTVDEVNSDSKCKTMVQSHHRLNDVVENKKLIVENGTEKCISTERIAYNGGPYSLPISSSMSIGNAALEKRAEYKYDGYMNIRSINIDGIETVYIWSYSGQYPIAKIEGVTLNEVINTMAETKLNQFPKGAKVEDMGMVALDEIVGEKNNTKILAYINTIRDKVNKLGGYITTYTYKPLVGMTSQTLPNGLKTTYQYDGFGRLIKVLDHNGKVISTNEYNYKK